MEHSLSAPASADTVDAAYTHAMAEHAGRHALIYLGERYSYKQLSAWVSAFARGLHELGAGPGDRIIIYLPHCPQWIIAWLAIQRLGATAVPVTHFYGDIELAYIAADSGTRIVICADTNFGYVRQVLGGSTIEQVVVTKLDDLLPVWKRALLRGLDRIPTGKFEQSQQVHEFKSVLSRAGDGDMPRPEPSPGHVTEILYTGGTTGEPKGVPINDGLFMQSVWEQRANSAMVIPPGEDVIVQGAPLNHILGQMVGLGTFLGGDALVLLPRMNMDALMDHVQLHDATTLFGTPGFLRMILEHDRRGQYDFSSLRYVFSGGDVLPVEVEQRWYDTYGLHVSQGYGATETCGGVTLVPADATPPAGTAGKVIPSKEILLIDSDTEEPVPPGQPGELLVASDHMVEEYLNKPEETEIHFVRLQGKLWYKTGDVVRFDEDGWMFFVDRSCDIIKHKGYRVAAAKVESVLLEHEAVVGACVVGTPDEKVGERIKAVVVAREDAKGLSSQELIRWTRDRLASYEMPQYIEFRDMLPRSRVGKILRRELRDEERRKLEE